MAIPILPGVTASAGGAMPIAGGRGGDAAPSWAGGSNMFDHSGWNVNFGGGSITSSATKAGELGLGAYLPYLLLGMAGLLLWRFTKKS